MKTKFSEFMLIHHLAIWTSNLERLKDFYISYFNGVANEKYRNEPKCFESYFVRFDHGAQLEIMQMNGIPENKNDIIAQSLGLIHVAISVGSRNKVNELTETLRHHGHRIVSEPRQTGDGYYESGILDPDGNRIELIA